MSLHPGRAKADSNHETTHPTMQGTYIGVLPSRLTASSAEQLQKELPRTARYGALSHDTVSL